METGLHSNLTINRSILPAYKWRPKSIFTNAIISALSLHLSIDRLASLPPREMDPSPAPSQEETTTRRDWSELPVDALSVVFAKLGAVEVLMGAGLVCRPWLDAAKLPHLWRCVDMAAHHHHHHHHRRIPSKKKRAVLCAMAEEAVRRADGQLEAFMARAFVTNKLLKHVGDRYIISPIFLSNSLD